MVYSLQNLGNSYLLKEDYDSALVYLNEMGMLIGDSTPANLVMDYCNNMGVIYEESNDFAQSAIYYARAVESDTFTGTNP